MTQDAGTPEPAPQTATGPTATQRVEAVADRAEVLFKRGRSRLGVAGLRKFILRGNVVDLALGVTIGAAFGAFVAAVVRDFLTPLLNIPLGGSADLANRYWEIGGSKFKWGDVLNNLVALALAAFALYYFVVVPMNALIDRYRSEPDPSKRTKVCPECKSSIPWDATRCAFCTVQQPPLAEAQLTQPS